MRNSGGAGLGHSAALLAAEEAAAGLEREEGSGQSGRLSQGRFWVLFGFGGVITETWMWSKVGRD